MSDCPIDKCNGSMLISTRDASGIWSGHDCECKPIQIKRGRLTAIENLLSKALIPSDYAIEGFDGFDRARQPKAYSLARAWAKSPDHWLYLTGDVGEGKTHLAAAAIRQMVSSNMQALAVSAPMLIALLRRSIDTRKADIMIDMLCEVDYLAIDDIGTREATPYTTETFLMIVETRVICKRPTLITSNLTVDQLEQMEGWRRIGDRIVGASTLLKMDDNGSYRQEQSRKRKEAK